MHVRKRKELNAIAALACVDAVCKLVLWLVAGMLCALPAAHMQHAHRIRCPYVGRAIKSG
jgi:hypothetical protein